jgi:hypothetical protein
MLLRPEDHVLLGLCGTCLLGLGYWYFCREVNGGRNPQLGLLVGMSGVVFAVLSITAK